MELTTSSGSDCEPKAWNAGKHDDECGAVMGSEALPDSLYGGVVPTFLRYVGASILGLLALSGAAIVDGLLVGKLLGAEALAAVNFLIPLFTLFFGVSLMLAIGGSVDAGHHLGAGRRRAACAAFSRSLLAVGAFACLCVLGGALFPNSVLSTLAVPNEVQLLAKPYFLILLLGVLPQLMAVVLYYFLRLSGQPGLASRALIIGALLNIVLDVLFLLVFKLGLTAAACATVVAQFTQFGLLATYFHRRQEVIGWSPRGLSWRRLGANISNGFSEFVNEISAGVVLFAVHWLLARSLGVEGVAAFALINYSLLINVMVACAVAEVVQVLVSQNVGAKQLERALQFRRCGFITVIALGGLLFVSVQLGGQSLSLWFFEKESTALTAQKFWHLIAPMFFLTGCNLVFSAWFTGLRKAWVSAFIALSRTLILPLSLMAFLSVSALNIHFLWALPLAEAVTLSLTIGIYRRHSGARNNV